MILNDFEKEVLKTKVDNIIFNDNTITLVIDSKIYNIFLDFQVIEDYNDLNRIIDNYLDKHNTYINMSF
jgi:hypothetical protein